MKIVKGAIAVVVGVILWYVAQVGLTMLLAVATEQDGLVEGLLNVWAGSKLFGHIFNVLFFAIPCLLPAFVASKITAGDADLTRWVLWIIVMLVFVSDFLLFWRADVVMAIEATIGIIALVYAFIPDKVG